MNDVAIKIENLRFSYGLRNALKDITLTVRKGEYLSIVGPNGAGKTTLLKCVNRIYRGNTGSIQVAGKPLRQYSQKELACSVAYVPQASGRRRPPFTVYEYVMMARYPYLSPFSTVSPEDKKAVARALEETETSPLADRYMDTLSGGECQKVYLAGALAQGVHILLLDEPTTFLDPKHEADIQALLWRSNHKKSTTIVSVTHDINRATLASDRVVAMKEGAIVFDGTSKEFMTNAVLEKIYSRSFIFTKHPQSDKTVIVPECAI